MFRAFSRPSSGAQQPQEQPLVLPSGVVKAVLLVVVGPVPVRPRPKHCYHHAPTVKPEAVTAVVVAPDDGHDDAQNMLSCK